MISAGDFRNGMTFEMDGEVFQVVKFQHVKPGKGAAFVRTTYRNVRTGAVLERSFNPSEKFEEAQLERRDMSFLYQDGDLYYFMDEQTYEQMPLDKSLFGDSLQFLKENMVCRIVSYKGDVFEIELPNFVELKVVRAEPGVRGDTATSATKNAELETGAVIRVPLFINEGEIVRVDTRSGTYLERA
ncbi:MAG: elongation factor P [Clostridiaceae bacterium]|nr:elongation factor P [Clostridiaceae bacterium]